MFPIHIVAPAGLAPGVYGSSAQLVSTPAGPVLNVEYDPFADPKASEHPITVGSGNRDI